MFAITEVGAPAPRCPHCTRRAIAPRRRGLCWKCSLSPAIRDLFPSTSKYGRRGVSGGNARRPLAESPTTAPPGTPEKLAVLEQRAEEGRAIFHPADARWPGDPRTQEYLGRIAA